jgi:hypothetical protein
VAAATFERAGLLHRFQSNVVLRLARWVFLASAAISLLTVVFGLLVALYFHIQMQGSAAEEPMPSTTTPMPTTLDFGRIDARLAPPQGIRFIFGRQPITPRFTATETLGYFEASSINNLSRYPEDFDILGGADANLFRRVAVNVGGQTRSGLGATPALAERVTQAFAADPSGTRLRFEITVVARDAYGAFSAPSDVTVELVLFGTQPSTTPSVTPTAPTIPPRQLSAWERFAREVALHVDAAEGPPYERALQAIMQIPQNCGTTETAPGLLDSARRAFEHARAKLSPSTVQPFALGFCEAWRELAAAQQAARAQDANARVAVERRNAQAQQETRLKQAAAFLARNLTMTVVGSAFGTFLVLALLLALLAIENHSKALREVATALAEARKPTPETPPATSTSEPTSAPTVTP